MSISYAGLCFLRHGYEFFFENIELDHIHIHPLKNIIFLIPSSKTYLLGNQIILEISYLIFVVKFGF